MKAAREEGEDGPPVALRRLREERAVLQPDVGGLDDEIDGKPDEGEEIARPDEEQGEHGPARCE